MNQSISEQSKPSAAANSGLKKASVKHRKIPLKYKLMSFSARFLSVIAPALAARWLENIFVTPRKFDQPDYERNWMKGAETTWLKDKHGIKLPLYSWGSGPIILLVHGLSGRASQLGAFVHPLQNLGYRIITFDAPAHGNAGGKQTNLPEIAEVLLDVSRHIGPVHGIIAHSNGAAATSIALSNGLKAERIVYISAPEYLSGHLQKLAILIGFSHQVAMRTQSNLEKQSGFSFAASRGKVLAASMDKPLLMFHDKDDRIVPFEEGQLIGKTWPGAKFIATSGLGHGRILKDEKVISTSTDFLTTKKSFPIL